MNLLALPNFQVIHTDDLGDLLLITAKRNEQPDTCSVCGVVNAALYRHGTIEQEFVDLPIRTQPVRIKVIRQRYKCRECGGTFMELLPEMHETRQATMRFVSNVEQESLRRTFSDLANRYRVDEKTIRNIFRDYIKRLDDERELITPSKLGIDEIHLLGKPRCVLANLDNNSIFDMLETRKRGAVVNYLMRLPNRNAIELVSIDMWNPYRDAVQAALPQAEIIVDKFHAVRMANIALETVRKEIRTSLPTSRRRQLMHDRYVLLRRRRDLNPQQYMLLDVWIANFPQLGEAYRLKEEFFDIWDTSLARAIAESRYERWSDSIPTELRPAFQPILTAVNNWHDEIFNYFDHRITNAFTEAMNGITRIINRNGRGYSFEAIRAKMIYGTDTKEEIIRDGDEERIINIENIWNQFADEFDWIVSTDDDWLYDANEEDFSTEESE